MKVLESVVNWMFFDKFGFAEATGFEYIFMAAVLIGCVAVCVSKKLRSKFF